MSSKEELKKISLDTSDPEYLWATDFWQGLASHYKKEGIRHEPDLEQDAHN